MDVANEKKVFGQIHPLLLNVGIDTILFLDCDSIELLEFTESIGFSPLATHEDGDVVMDVAKKWPAFNVGSFHLSEIQESYDAVWIRELPPEKVLSEIVRLCKKSVMMTFNGDGDWEVLVEKFMGLFDVDDSHIIIDTAADDEECGVLALLRKEEDWT